jgi:hypothetical protein
MGIALILMLCAGPLAAFDVIYFHLYRFKLYSRPQSVYEEITHIARGTLFPLGLAIFLYGKPQGAWFWWVAALFAVEVVNSLVDITLEPRSRAPLRVPGLELVVHYTGATVMGAVIATYLIFGWSAAGAPTGFAPYQPGELPWWVIPYGYLSVAIGAGLVLFETALFLRHLSLRRSASINTFELEARP